MLKFEIIGHLGADAVSREQNGQKFVTFRVAHTERFTRADGTEVDNTSWVSCIMNGDGGKLLPYLKQGAQVFVSGDGSFRLFSSEKARGFVATGDIRVRNVELIGGRQDDVPSRLYTENGEQVEIYKAYFVIDDKLVETELLTKNGRRFKVDVTRFVTPVQEQQEQADFQGNSDGSPNEVF